jgi:hypothetical protein
MTTDNECDFTSGRQVATIGFLLPVSVSLISLFICYFSSFSTPVASPKVQSDGFNGEKHKDEIIIPLCMSLPRPDEPYDARKSEFYYCQK